MTHWICIFRTQAPNGSEHRSLNEFSEGVSKGQVFWWGDHRLPSITLATDAPGIPNGPSIEKALSFLSQALSVLDSLDISPEIGARLQEVITALEDNAP